MSYKAKCESCDCPISMEDDFDMADDRRCEECRESVDYKEMHEKECEDL